ncbi:MAG: TonB-dependent receptor [Kiritimatiellia bacterium]
MDALSYDAGLSYQRDEGYRKNSLSWSKNANASLSYDITGEDTLTFRFSGGENYYQLPGPLTYEQYKKSPKKSSNRGDQDAHTDSGLITSLYEAERDWGKMQLNAGLNMRNIDWEMSGMHGWNQQRGYSLSPKIMYGDEDDYSISGGIDLLYDTLDFTGQNNVKINYAELNRLTTGPFLLAKKKFFDALTFSAGARYERARTDGKNLQYNKADMIEVLEPPYPWLDPIPNPDYPAQPIKEASFDDSFYKEGWSYEAAILWEVTENFSLWCRYNRVYRYPALDESASYQGYPLEHPLNAGLEPETGDNFEVGGKLRCGSWSGSATLFYLMMDDEISYDDQKKLNTNIGETERLGSDLQLAFERDIYGASCMTELVAAKFRDGANKGEHVPLVPDAHGVVTLWVEPLADFRLTGNYTWVVTQYQGGDFSNKMRKIDGYGLFGVRADLTLMDHLGLFVKVDNLLDQAYASSAYTGAWYPGMGRALYGGLTLEF